MSVLDDDDYDGDDDIELTVERMQLGNYALTRWRQQHEYLEKLNMQSVLCAAQKEDEFVKEFLITHQKIHVLIHELIATEIWTEKVFPEFINLNIEQDLLFPVYMVVGDNILSFIVDLLLLYHQATVINLLETALYHSDACEAADDSIVDLIDYVYRKLTYLVTSDLQADLDEINAPSDLSSIASSSLEELEKMERKLRFDISVKAVSILRYITDHLQSLPLSATTRLLQTHDIPVLLVHFMETSPGTRTVRGNLMKYVDSKWQVVEPDDQSKLTKLEGQIWITIFQLLLSDGSRNKYDLNSYRKNIILKLRSFLTQVLFDQMPVLCELQRYLEQLAIVDPPAVKSDFMIEQVPVVWQGFMKKYDGKWSKLAKEQSETHFNTSTSDWKESAKMLAETYSFDVLESLISDPPKCAVCGELASKRCSRCQNEWYCRRECQVKHWPKHKKVCDMMVEPVHQTVDAVE